MSGCIIFIKPCPLVIGLIGSVLERGVVVTILQVFGVYNACMAAGVDDTVKSNQSGGAVILARVGH